ncbi:MAG: hypothetical protein AAF549_08275 [Pseudomonadota bacterium]
MRLLLLGAFVLASFTTAAQAKEQIKVHEIHTFISSLNSAINSGVYSRVELEEKIASNAVFEDNLNANNLNYMTVNSQLVAPYYAYRYPYHHGFRNVGLRAMNKWDKITQLETKKRTIPGYRGQFLISDFTVSPIRDTAVVKVDFKEESLSYAPGLFPYHQYASLNTHSKCNMHLGKMNGELHITAMYCNTNTNMPF